MKRTTGILVCTLAAGMAWAQSPEIIQNTRTKMDTVQQNKTAASNEALGIKQPAAKDSHAKPAATPVKSSAAVVKTSVAPAKPSVAPVKTSAVSAKTTVTKASVVPAKASVTPAKVSVAPAKVSVAPAKASVAPAKASVVPGKVSVAPAKASVAPAKASVAPAKVSVAPAKVNAASDKPKVVASPTSKSAVPFAPKKAASVSSTPKITVKQVPAKKVAKPAVANQKVGVAPTTKNSPSASASSTTSDSTSAGQDEKASDDDAVKDAQDKKWSMSGKRDPFISPVVSHTGGSGCSTGKKCLEIGAINLRGVVHADAGFIAVVTNSLNKAYFLRENDPVFNGYVVKITGDSVIFKETMQDRLGKTFTREVVKKITTPAV